MEFLNVTSESEQEFERIARKLFNNYAIQNHESTYRIVEIEFYWNSSTHKDDSTYKRKYLNPKQGEWFFHYSGVDVALGNAEKGGYGGILIRGIYDVVNNQNYKGPMVCAMKLFSGTDAFSESIKTKLIEKEFKPVAISKSPRIGLGKNAKESGTENFNYRYFINPNDNRLSNK